MDGGPGGSSSAAQMVSAGSTGPHWSDRNPSDFWSFQALIGKGSYGKVYRASSRADGQLVAFKVLPLEEDTIADEIVQELGSLRRCDHRNVVRYHSSYIFDAQLWIAMEYCTVSTQGVMRQSLQPLAEVEIAAVCAEALRGLDYLHSVCKLIHRDVKAGNILLTEAGAVKLADFGVAAQISGTLAKRSTVIGSPMWMSPEMIEAGSYDRRTDIWSLGITAIELAQLNPPHFDVSPPVRVLFLIPQLPPPQLERPEQWSSPFVHFVSRCVLKEPSERPDAAGLLLDPFVNADNVKDDAHRATLLRGVLMRDGVRAARSTDTAGSAASSTVAAGALNCSGGGRGGSVELTAAGLPRDGVALSDGTAADGTLPAAWAADRMASVGGVLHASADGTVDLAAVDLAAHDGTIDLGATVDLSAAFGRSGRADANASGAEAWDAQKGGTLPRAVGAVASLTLLHAQTTGEAGGGGTTAAQLRPAQLALISRGDGGTMEVADAHSDPEGGDGGTLLAPLDSQLLMELRDRTVVASDLTALPVGTPSGMPGTPPGLPRDASSGFTFMEDYDTDGGADPDESGRDSASGGSSGGVKATPGGAEAGVVAAIGGLSLDVKPHMMPPVPPPTLPVPPGPPAVAAVSAVPTLATASPQHPAASIPGAPLPGIQLLRRSSNAAALREGIRTTLRRLTPHRAARSDRSSSVDSVGNEPAAKRRGVTPPLPRPPSAP
mmetsp:Transcript_53326/g.137917  ORF Transcript_53326/g.137917 Transcript_53326/m.137917 type:complete len:720 (-) Transcript_53326:196-2355(-)